MPERSLSTMGLKGTHVQLFGRLTHTEWQISPKTPDGSSFTVSLPGPLQPFMGLSHMSERVCMGLQWTDPVGSGRAGAQS